jgi:predicted alpha-1,2-mannosidase
MKKEYYLQDSSVMTGVLKMESSLKSNLLIFSIFLIFQSGSMLTAQPELISYVNPFIGTDAHGHTYPGASYPFGMVQLSPDTDIKGWDWCSGYHYSDKSIIGFSHTHLSGTGVGDYGDILFMPTTGVLKTEPGSKENPDEGYRSRFSHENETASPGYYSVFLNDYKIKAELTVTPRAGFHKYTFPSTDQGHIIIDLIHGIEDKTTDSQIEIKDNHIIKGYRRSTGWAKDHCIYFYAEFSKPFKSYGIVENGELKENVISAKGKFIRAYVDYNTSDEETVQIKVGISHTSLEGAEQNLKTEIPGWDFDEVKRNVKNEWEKELSVIIVNDTNSRNKIIFYTALYHSLLNPNLFSDTDGSYIGLDKKIYNDPNRKVYTILSLWDVFRAAFPLISITDRKRTNEIIQTLLSKYDESGLLPVWELAGNETGTMIGYHSIPVITDAIIKGIADFDIFKAYNAMKKSAMQDQLGLKYYKEMGYIPSDLESESVSKTLEYAYDDWCISQTANHLWKAGILPEAEEDYYYFTERAKYYVNVFDPSTNLMRAKKNGRWFEPFDPYSVSGNYTEANAWQYSFFVPQDVNGLIKLIGGDGIFISMLDSLFNAPEKLTGRVQSDITGLIGQYAHGNEPSHNMAYLYNYAGAPWKTQEKVSKIMRELYSEKTDGLSGNEDCGQMSAWYVLSAMGFYPVTPGDDKYIIGTPIFDSVKINPAGGKSFTITANNLSEQNIYIQSAKLNGKDYPYSYIRHQDIMDGGNLSFEMGPNPSAWGKDVSTRPLSEIKYEITAVPFLTSGERVFKDSVTVSVSTTDPSSEVYYSTDQSFPSTQYEAPLTLKNTSVLKTVSVKNQKFSKVVTSLFNKLAEGRSIELKSEFSHSYTGGGKLGLIDGVKGTLNYHTDAWQGYEGVDFEAVVDLGEVQNISYIASSFLKNTVSWIFLPASVEFHISKDGKNFIKVLEAANQSDPGEEIKSFEKLLDTEARYVKVFAQKHRCLPGMASRCRG